MSVSSIATQTGAHHSAATDMTESESPPQSSAGRSNSAQASAAVVTLSQAGLDFLSGSSTDDKSQSALSWLDQATQSSQQSIRDMAEQWVDRLSAQIRQLMLMEAFLSPRAFAGELAQLARQLAVAVQQYTQNQGTGADIADVGAVATIAAQPTTQAPSDNGQNPPVTAQTATDTATDTGQSATGTAGTNDNQDFQQSVHSVASQMEALLRDARHRLKKQPDSDLQATQSALNAIAQALPHS